MRSDSYLRDIVIAPRTRHATLSASFSHSCACLIFVHDGLSVLPWATDGMFRDRHILG